MRSLAPLQRRSPRESTLREGPRSRPGSRLSRPGRELGRDRYDSRLERLLLKALGASRSLRLLATDATKARDSDAVQLSYRCHVLFHELLNDCFLRIYFGLGLLHDYLHWVGYLRLTTGYYGAATTSTCAKRRPLDLVSSAIRAPEYFFGYSEYHFTTVSSPSIS